MSATIRCLSALLLLMVPLMLKAQQEDASWEQVYQEVMGVEDADDEAGWAENYELLETLAEQPLDLNRATREDLEQLPFLSELQVMDFLEYRDRYGVLRSMGELRMVRSMDWQQIRLLPFFTFVGEVDEKEAQVRRDSLWLPDKQNWQRRRWWQSGKETPHKLTATGRIPLYRRHGDRAGYQGYPYRHWLRYEYSTGSRLKAGFGASQDAGEPFFAGKNRWGYDAYTYYLQLRKRGPLENLVAGKFKVTAGMGLILNNSFSLGKMVLLQNMGRTPSVLRPHTSSAESDYFQGAGATVKLNSTLTLTTFASYRPVDGTLNAADGSVATLLYSGYHRTEAELLKKYNTHIGSVGGGISFRKNDFHVGINSVYSHLDRRLSPDRSTLYRRHYPHGRDFVNASMDYSYGNRTLSLKGETATDGHGALATLNVLSGRLSPNVSALLMQRFYSYRYTTLHGHSLSDGGRVQNESGIYAGVLWRLSPAFRLRGYADYAYSPWARYQVSQASRAYDFLLHADYMLPHWHLQARTRAHLRKHDNDTKTALTDNNDYRCRLSVTYKDGGPLNLTAKTQLDAARAVTPEASYGLMASQQVSLRIGHWQLWALAACFRTDGYNSRLYLYEHQLPGNFSYPMFYGRGLRLTTMVVYEPADRLRLMAKVGYTDYFDRTTIGTGLQQIDHSSMTDIDMQLRLRL